MHLPHLSAGLVCMHMANSIASYYVCNANKHAKYN